LVRVPKASVVTQFLIATIKEPRHSVITTSDLADHEAPIAVITIA